jgi:hypothetical protein
MTQTRTPGQKVPGQKVPGQKAPGQKAGRPPRPRSAGSVTLTSRGAVVALVAACFLSLLLAAVTGWGIVADAVFVMACGLVACYTRIGGLRTLVVCPPLAFFAGSVLAQVITAPDGFTAVAGILVTLGSSAPWLFTGTVLAVVIALGRGWRPSLLRWPLLGNLREALKDLRPRGDRRVRPRLRTWYGSAARLLGDRVLTRCSRSSV